MNRGFYSGISGTKSYMNGLNVLSNNISNVSTVGFKRSSPGFSDIFYSSLPKSPTTPTANDMGYGVTMSGTRLEMEQGGIKGTDMPYNLAIEGKGFFKVASGSDFYYTRKGEFILDKDFNLVDSNGSFVTGKMIDLSKLSDKPVSINSIDQASEQFLRLDKRLELKGSNTTKVSIIGQFNINDRKPLSIKRDIFLNGKKSSLIMNFKQAINKSGGIDYIGSAKIFDDKKESKSVDLTLNFNSKGILKNSDIKLSNDLSLDFSKLHISSKKKSISLLSNERDNSLLKEYSINQKGLISATFNNGIVLPVGRIPLYHFRNEEGLRHLDNGYYNQTSNSGIATTYAKDGSYVTGAIIESGSLELSNTNLATALTDLIVMQKSFASNSKTITVNNDLIKTAIGMKR